MICPLNEEYFEAAEQLIFRMNSPFVVILSDVHYFVNDPRIYVDVSRHLSI